MASKRQVRVRRSPAQWQRLFNEHRESGLGTSAFCAARGLSPSSFHLWKRKLEAGSQTDEPAGFVELTPTGGSQPSAWDLELELGEGVVVRLRRR